MPEPAYDDAVRAYMRMATYLIGRGMTDEEVMAWAADSRHHYNLDDMRTALPEARRALYFAEVIRGDASGRSFAQLWYYNRGRTFRAGYGRMPTADERSWAYSRPGSMLGLAVQISGRGEQTGLPRRYEVTINVPWNANWAEVEDYVRNQVMSGSLTGGLQYYDPIQPITMVIQLVGGALIERRATTYTMS